MIDAKEIITCGQATLGMEFGSTNIKSVLIGPDHEVLASGNHVWANTLVDGLWSYSLADVIAGMQDCYRDLAANVSDQYQVEIEKISSIGLSGMMHGYLAFDENDELLVPFRTWRNTNTVKAAAALTEIFQFNIPVRWSVAHLYQAFLDDEPHVAKLAHLYTLSSYVHWLLSGERVIGVGDASGMFPVDSVECNFDAAMLKKFDDLVGSKVNRSVADIFPKVLVAGQNAGRLTAAGAQLLDPTGKLKSGALMCPPEGDAGTGMVATNAVSVRTGNVSTGTSIFSMVVLEHPLSRIHPEIDMVTTPAGDAVAMVHCNNGASELGEWAAMFADFSKRIGSTITLGEVFDALMKASLEAEPDGGGLMSFNYLAGEPITELVEGRPLFFRTPDSRFNLANFIRVQLYAVLATLRLGMDILKDEDVSVELMIGHGGFFKTAGVGQSAMANALNIPVSVGKTASNGGAWGIAVLAEFAASGEDNLASYLAEKVFSPDAFSTITPNPDEVNGFERFLSAYRRALAVQRCAVENS